MLGTIRRACSSGVDAVVYLGCDFEMIQWENKFEKVTMDVIAICHQNADSAKKHVQNLIFASSCSIYEMAG